MMPLLAFAELVPMATHGSPAIHLAVIQPGEVMVAAIVFGTMGTVLYPLARALARRLEAGTRSAPPGLLGVEERLDRIERSVESIAVEVERVSEGQRFVTKLLAERPSASLPRSDS
jgi:hypothetical protein